jgi:transcriptional regulator with XRE-family HTH domain
LLGDNIKAARKAAGLSQQAAASASGTGLAHYGRVERGEIDPQVGTLVRIAAGLGVSAAYLLRGIDVKARDAPALPREHQAE